MSAACSGLTCAEPGDAAISNRMAARETKEMPRAARVCEVQSIKQSPESDARARGEEAVCKFRRCELGDRLGGGGPVPAAFWRMALFCSLGSRASTVQPENSWSLPGRGTCRIRWAPTHYSSQ